MGSGLKESYLELKTTEWWDYHNAVSAWEIDRYLTLY
jgi:glutamine synthetase